MPETIVKNIKFYSVCGKCGSMKEITNNEYNHIIYSKKYSPYPVLTTCCSVEAQAVQKEE